MGAIQVQDGRSTIIPAIILGVDLLPPAQVLTVSAIPTTGNIYNDGIIMSIGSTMTVQDVLDNKLTFLSSSGTLGLFSFAFDGGTYSVDITIVVGIVGKLFLMAKVVPAELLITDTLPREIPKLLADKLAYGLASRMLERGDRRSDDVMAVRAGAKFEDAKTETIAAINSFGGNFNTLESI